MQTIQSLYAAFRHIAFYGFQLSFHGLLYIFNAILVLLLLLALAWVLFHKRIDSVAKLFFYALPALCGLITAASIFNLLLPFSSKGALIFLAVIALLSGGYFLITKGHKSSWKFLNNKVAFRSLLKYGLIFFALLLFYNLPIFTTALPYAAAEFNDDFYRHNNFIKNSQFVPDTVRLAKEQQNAIRDSDSQVKLFLPYPLGVHITIAFLDKVLPMSFITPSEYSLVMLATFGLGVIAYAQIKQKNIWEVWPLLFLPSLVVLALRDHINSALLVIPVFLIYVFFIEKICQEQWRLKMRDWLYLGFLFLCGILVYSFSLIILAVPLFLIMMVFFFRQKRTQLWIKNHQFITLIICLVILVVVGIGTYLFAGYGAIIAGIVTDIGKTVGDYNLGILFGVVPFAHLPYDGELPMPFFQIAVILFWGLLIVGRVYPQKTFQKNLNSSILLFAVGVFLLLLLPMIFPIGYLLIRFYVLVMLLTLVWLINTDSTWTNKKWYLTLMTIISILVGIYFMKLNADMFFVRKSMHINSLIGIDYQDMIELTNHIPSGSRVIEIEDGYHLPSTINLFLKGQYEFINRPLDMGDWSNDLSVVDFTAGDYLISNPKNALNYPKLLLEKIYEDKKDKIVVFKINQSVADAVRPIVSEKYKGGGLTPANYDEVLGENEVMIGYIKDGNNCYFTGPSADFKGVLEQNLAPIDVEDTEPTFQINFVLLLNERLELDETSSHYCERTIETKEIIPQ